MTNNFATNMHIPVRNSDFVDDVWCVTVDMKMYKIRYNDDSIGFLNGVQKGPTGPGVPGGPAGGGGPPGPDPNGEGGPGGGGCKANGNA